MSLYQASELPVGTVLRALTEPICCYAIRNSFVGSNPRTALFYITKLSGVFSDGHWYTLDEVNLKFRIHEQNTTRPTHAVNLVA